MSGNELKIKYYYITADTDLLNMVPVEILQKYGIYICTLQLRI